MIGCRVGLASASRTPASAAPPALVVQWAGHSVNVLPTVYAKALDGAESETLERIWQATRRPED